VSKLAERSKKIRIKLGVLGQGQLFGEEDCILKRSYTTSLKCTRYGSQAYIMPRADFLRLFQKNEEAWKVMFTGAQRKEQIHYERIKNFVSVNREEH
jgi:CRP-like cAMP-binding protein